MDQRAPQGEGSGDAVSMKKKLDLSAERFYDDHTHLLFTDRTSVTLDEFVLNYYHGVRDEIGPDGLPRPSRECTRHTAESSVVKVLVHAMAERFGFDESPEALVEFRNSNTSSAEHLAAYTAMLYRDANVCGCTLDSELPMGDERTACFPCPVNRLFQYERVFFQELKRCGSYRELLSRVMKSVEQASKEGFAGLKGHVGEQCGFSLFSVSEGDAERAFAGAKEGNAEQLRAVYYAMFERLLELCRELDLPLHLHTGSTGFKKRTSFHSLDPILMAPFLKEKRIFRTKIVLLHQSFPFTRNAAIMAANFPNVWLDLSQTLPWQALMFDSCLSDALSVTSHDKIMLGTGQHWYAEMVWLASYVAKRSLERVMEQWISSGFLSEKQALATSRRVLCENALELYAR